MSGYLADVAALARKDLLLELRARDTLPAMLLFVVSTLVVFHFALPGRLAELAATGLLWVAIVFTALLGLARAFVAEREQGVLDALVLAPCDRSAIWLGKSLARRSRSSSLAEVVALPAFALFFSPVDGATVAGGRARGRRHLRGRHAARRDGGRQPRARAAPAAPLPAARDPVVVGGVGASVADDPAVTSASSASTTPSLRCSAGPPLSTSLRNNSSSPRSRSLAAVLLGGAIALAFFCAPDDADQGFSQRIFYFHVPIALTAYACFGWGAWKALRHLWKRRARARPRELRRHPPGRDLRRC